MKLKTWIVLIGLTLSVVCEAKITLPAIWKNNMVLQQQATVHMRGKAVPNKQVSVKTSWNPTNEIIVKSNANGEWVAPFDTPVASDGTYTISVSDGEVFTINDVLIGDVWLCSGQSNMEMPMKGYRGQPVSGSQQYIVTANPKRSLHMFTVAHAWSTTPKEDFTGEWLSHSPENVSEFSATAYFFGNLLESTLNVPIGLINSSWGGSKIEAWIDKETFSQFPAIDLSVLKNKDFGYPNGTPTLLFNAMIKPLEGFPIKGVIWYQGESNVGHHDLYKKLFAAFASQWRAFFNSPDLPVYYVQIAPWQGGGSDKIDWALFREGQLQSMKEVPHVGMVTTGDAGDELCIHPPQKAKVGERLAYWALAKTYGIKGFMYSGPVFEKYKLNNSVVELKFEYGQDGLNPERQQVTGFEIAGEDGVFLPAKAEIIGGEPTVKVWHDSISKPIEVRYCFRNYMEGNLTNNAGIPASPFRVEIK